MKKHIKKKDKEDERMKKHIKKKDKEKRRKEKKTKAFEPLPDLLLLLSSRTCHIIR